MMKKMNFRMTNDRFSNKLCNYIDIVLIRVYLFE